MSDEQKQVEEKVDHAERAREMVSAVGGPQDPRNPGAIAYLVGAQVHASLAIAEQLERLNGNLADLLGDGSHLDGLKCAVRDGLPWAGRGE